MVQTCLTVSVGAGTSPQPPRPPSLSPGQFGRWWVDKRGSLRHSVVLNRRPRKEPAMPTRLRLLHDLDAPRWARCCPRVRATRRSAPLALFALGLLWAGSAALPRAMAASAAGGGRRRQHRAAAAPLAGQPGRRRRRGLWRGLLPGLLASRAGQGVLLVLDPTPQNGAASPCWRWGWSAASGCCRWPGGSCPSRSAWPQPQIAPLRAMFAEVAAALPPDCAVTVVGDRGLPSARTSSTPAAPSDGRRSSA